MLLLVMAVAGVAGRAQFTGVPWMREHYQRLLRTALMHRTAAVLVILLLASSTVYPFKRLQRTDQQRGGEDSVRVFLDMPSGQTLEQANAFMTRMEEAIMALKARYNIERLESRFEAASGYLRSVLEALCRRFGGGPVGVSTLAVAVGEERETVEEVAEPFLVRMGMLARTPRGRAT